MLYTYEERLYPIRRAIGESVDFLTDMKWPLKHWELVTTGGGGIEVSREILKGIEAAISLVNMLSAVYQDLGCAERLYAGGETRDACRVKFEANTGAVLLDWDGGNIDLITEVQMFLLEEQARIQAWAKELGID